MRTLSFVTAVMACIATLGALPGANAGEEPRITVESVKPTPLKGKDYFHDVTGTVTIPKATRKGKEFIVVVYTKSGEGGNVQLQTVGRPEERTQEPRTEDLKFDHDDTVHWKMRIWLGDASRKCPAYELFAVVIPSLDDDQATRLLSLTYNRYKNFRSKGPRTSECVLSVLEKEGFGPVVWTSKTVDMVP